MPPRNFAGRRILVLVYRPIPRRGGLTKNRACDILVLCERSALAVSVILTDQSGNFDRSERRF